MKEEEHEHGQRFGGPPANEDALPGRSERMAVPARHFVNGAPLEGLPAGMQEAVFGMGCFWGAEKGFWTIPGVVSTSVGYAGGTTPNPTYREVCSGGTGHAEVVRVVFDPARSALRGPAARLLGGPRSHAGDAPGQRRRHAVPVGDLHLRRRPASAAEASRDAYEKVLRTAGYGAITTEIAPAPEYYFAEEYHQQYLAKNPDGYCGHGGTGVSCPIGVAAARS